MTRIAIPLLLLGILTWPFGCGGGGGADVDPELLDAAECTSGSLQDLDVVFGDILDLLASLGGPLPTNVTPGPGPNQYTIASSLGAIIATVTSADDITDGVDPGESAAANWILNGGLTQATVAGEGIFNLVRITATTFRVTGNGATADGACAIDVTSLNLFIDEASALGAQGSMIFTATTPTGDMAGSIAFDGSDFATVTAQFAGASVTFDINLNTFEPVF